MADEDGQYPWRYDAPGNRWRSQGRLPITITSGFTRCKKRVISETARTQYSSCTELPQKYAAASDCILWWGSVAVDGVSDIGEREREIENGQVEMRAALAPSLLAPYNHRFQRRRRRDGFQSREAS